jgi:hypothetical protein
MTTTTIAVEWAVSDVTATGYPIVSLARRRPRHPIDTAG